jgi:transposase
MLESLMPHYAALDVSNAETAIHVVDEVGRTVWRGKRASDPKHLPQPFAATRPTSFAWASRPAF